MTLTIIGMESKVSLKFVWNNTGDLSSPNFNMKSVFDSSKQVLIESLPFSGNVRIKVTKSRDIRDIMIKERGNPPFIRV